MSAAELLGARESVTSLSLMGAVTKEVEQLANGDHGRSNTGGVVRNGAADDDDDDEDEEEEHDEGEEDGQPSGPAAEGT